MDSFKKYLQDNKDKLDTDQAPPAAWENIREKLNERRGQHEPPRFINVRILVAASILAVTVAGVLFYITRNSTAIPPLPENNIAVVQSPKETLPPATNATSYPAALPPAPAARKHATGREARQVRKSPVKTAFPLDASLGEINAAYIPAINDRLRAIRHLPLLAGSPGDLEEFKTQFKEFDKEEREVLNVIKNTGMNNSLLLRLNTIYQQKLHLLGDLEMEIIKMNNYSNGKMPSKGTSKLQFALI